MASTKLNEGKVFDVFNVWVNILWMMGQDMKRQQQDSSSLSNRDRCCQSKISHFSIFSSSSCLLLLLLLRFVPSFTDRYRYLGSIFFFLSFFFCHTLYCTIVHTHIEFVPLISVVHYILVAESGNIRVD